MTDPYFSSKKYLIKSRTPNGLLTVKTTRLSAEQLTIPTIALPHHRLTAVPHNR